MAANLGVGNTVAAGDGAKFGGGTAGAVDAVLTDSIARKFPEGYEGAVVVMNYRTGEILSMVSKGEYDPDEEQSFAPALCNRIDRNTGGIVIAAKNAEITTAKEAIWLTEKFGEGEYKDILGLCKLADRTEIAEKGYSLTPGAYVGVAPVADDGVDFAARMAEIHSELITLQAESNELMDTISKNMKEMGL